MGPTESGTTWKRSLPTASGQIPFRLSLIHIYMDDVPRRGGRRRPKASRVVSQATQPLKAVKRKIRIEEAIRVADMAHQMGLKSNEIIKVLFNLGIMATINKALDIDTASVVAAEFGYEVEKVGFAEEQYLACLLYTSRCV